jgi:hypothetical protein
MNNVRILTATAATALALVVGTGPALAHYCSNVSKQAGAGSIGTYNIATESFTPAKKGGGAFITVTDGQSFSFDAYMYHTLPEGALAAGPGGDDQCDGQAIDNALACLGISE